MKKTYQLSAMQVEEAQATQVPAEILAHHS